MLLWCVNNLDIPQLVRRVIDLTNMYIASFWKFLYQTGAVSFGRAHFGFGAGPIHLDNVDCTGRESNLTDCPHSSFVSCSSGHSEDAGVRCQG